MVRSTLILLVLLLATPCSVCPQQALVAPLANDEAARGAELYKRYTAALQDWQRFEREILLKYGPALAKGLPQSQLVGIDAGSGKTIIVPSAWNSGIEFTADFRYAVPKSANR